MQAALQPGGGRKLPVVATYLFLSLYALAILYPLFFILMSSFKSGEEIFGSPWSLPRRMSLAVYWDLLAARGIARYILNSLYYSLLSMVVTVLSSAMAAYALVRMNWRLKALAMAFVLLGLMVPIHSELVPLYIILSRLGLRNPRITLVGVYTSFSIPISILILAGFLRSVPREMEEAAVIEGSSLLRAVFQVVFPLLQPALATIVILHFIGVWNDFFASLVFINLERDVTLQLGVARFQSSFGTNYPYLLSGVTLAILPSVLVYMLIQRRIIEGVTAGALKG
jgi:raffinose/stachyose/melibiose transport system permease protein